MKPPLPLEDKAYASLGGFHEALARIRGWDRPLRAACDAIRDAGSAPFVVLRHDVQRNLKSALTMAQWEFEAGMRGSFLLRPVGSLGEASSYYGRVVEDRIEPSQQMLADARAITSLGHDIGLLGPFDAAAARLGVTVRTFLQAQIALLRDAGVEVRCIAGAGTTLDTGVLDRPCAFEDLHVDATWGEAQLAAAASAMSVPARLLVRFDSDSWSRAGRKAPRDEPAAADISSALPDAKALPPLLLAGQGETPFAVALRGDDLARRMLLGLSRQEAPKGLNFHTAEATSCRSLADAIEGRRPDGEVACALVRLDAMPVLLRDAFLAQFSRAMLDAQRLDLLVIDTQVEYDRTYWRHREQGWAIWFPPRFVRGVDGLEALFEVMPPLEPDALAASILTLLRRLRLANPGLPAIVLCAESGSVRIPVDLARRLIDAFAAMAETGIHVLPVAAGAERQALGADADGQLIHRAWSDGLYRHFPRAADTAPEHSPVVAVAVAPVAPRASAPAPETTTAAPPDAAGSQMVSGVPLVCISYQRETPACNAGCARMIDSTAASLASYFLAADDAPDAPRRYTPTLLPMDEAWDFDAWEKTIKPLSGGNRLREKRKAIELGYTVRPFEYALYVPDIHEINHSKQVRSGGPMRGSYQRSVEEMGGAPTKAHAVRMPACPHHWGLMFGVFRPAPGRAQGTVIVDDQLVGYVSLRRVGAVALYSQILGHGDYLHDFVLVLLHHEIVRWLSSERERHARGLEFVMYGGAESGGESLLQWKRRAGFRPMRVVATGAFAEAPA